MTEIEAAAILLDQTLAAARRLSDWHADGTLTDAEYATAYRALVDAAECGPRCDCGAPATIGTTCAAHADRSAVLQAARASRPTINLARYASRAALTGAVIAALQRSGRDRPAQRFAARAAACSSMNALCQVAREYVRLESRMT